MIVLAASARVEVAMFISAVIDVYILLIFAHIVVNWLFAFGVRPPYTRASSAVIGFLRDVSEPYLRIFRNLVHAAFPNTGAFDFSPILAIFTLVLVNTYVVEGIIHG
jgi:YggT family protein